MSKRYLLDGVASPLELGKGGAKIKSNSGQLEARNNADDALVKIKAADGSASDDVVTKGQLDAFAPSGVVVYRTASVAHDSGASVNIGATITATAAFRWQVIVSTAFDGTAPTLDLGVSGDTDAIAANTVIDLKSVDTYSGVCNLDISSSTQLLATLAADSSSAGVATIIIEAI